MSAVRRSESLCFVSFGANLGDREENLRGGRAALEATTGARLRGASSVYETAPVGPGTQGRYLNAVVAIAWASDARALLDRLLSIERAHGRRRDADSEKWGPRTLDLDLLLFGADCIDEPGLVVPHPRLHERAFVLEPLCELAPALVHPATREPLERALEGCRAGAGVARLQAADWWATVPLASTGGERIRRLRT